jgi:seryl-tRNA synthetase
MHNDDKCANNLRKNNDDPRLELKEKDSRIDEYLNLSVELKAANKRANALIGNQAEENGKIVAELKAEVTKLRDALEKK